MNKHVLMLSPVPAHYFNINSWINIKDTDFTILVPIELKETYSLDELGTNVRIRLVENWNDKTLLEYAMHINSVNKIDVVFSFNEFELINAAKIRELLNIPGLSVKEAMFFRDKSLMKMAVAKENIRVPQFKIAAHKKDILDFAHKYKFPIVIKPKSSAGSQGVQVLRKHEELNELTNYRDCLLEKFVMAPMYHIDGLVIDNKSQYTMISKYLHSDNLSYRQGKASGSIQISFNSPIYDEIRILTEKILQSLPTPNNYIFHLEIFKTDQGYVFNEIGLRIGGGRILREIKSLFGIDPIYELLKSELGVTGNNVKINTKIHGWIMIPPRTGRLVSLPKHLPFENIYDVYTYGKINRIYDGPNNSVSAIYGISIISDTTLNAENELLDIEKFCIDNIYYESNKENIR